MNTGTKTSKVPGAVKNKANGPPEKQSVAKKIKPLTPTTTELKQEKPIQSQPKPKQKSEGKSTKNSAQRSRILFLFLNLVGQIVEVQVITGEVFEGIFHAAKLEPDSDELVVILRYARLKPYSSKKPKRGLETYEEYRINGTHIVQIHAVSVLFAPEKERYRDEGFMTDSEISGRELKERELIPWNPTESGATLEDLERSSATSRNWDQFTVNREKFGVTTTWDERIYTTDLDRDSEFYKAHEAKASKIAAEIERGSANGNIHLMEERGHDTSAYSEEELYSSVIREGKYIPPHQRNILQKSTSPTTAPSSKPTTPATDANRKPPKSLKEINSELELAAAIKTTQQQQQPQEEPSKPRPQLHLESVVSRTIRANSLSTKVTPTGSPTTILDSKAAMKERLKLRQQIVNHSSTGSPVGIGSPVTASPNLGSPVSPSLTDPLRALSLDPATPKISEEVAHEFMRFTLNEQYKNRNTEIEQLKKFSKSVDNKINKSEPAPITPPVTTPVSQPQVDGSLVLSMAKRNKTKEGSTTTPNKQTNAPPAKTTELKEEPKIDNKKDQQPGVINTEKHPPHTPTPATPGTPAPGVSNTVASTSKGTPAPTLTTDKTSTTTTTPTTTDKPTEVKKSTLNPNAKEFKFNPKAKAFVPPSRKTTPKPPSPSQSPPPPPQVYPQGPYVSYPPMNMYGPPPPIPYVPPMYGMPHMAPMPGIPIAMHHPHQRSHGLDEKFVFTSPNVDMSMKISEIYIKNSQNQKLVDPKTVSVTWGGGRNASYKDHNVPTHRGEQDMPQPHVYGYQPPFIPGHYNNHY